MSSTQILAAYVRAIARNIALARGTSTDALFDDSLSGDVARLQVFRKSRHMGPREQVWSVIDAECAHIRKVAA